MQKVLTHCPLLCYQKRIKLTAGFEVNRVEQQVNVNKLLLTTRIKNNNSSTKQPYRLNVL